MKAIGVLCAVSSLALWTASAESPAPHEGKSSESAQLEALAKKIDEQNAKIDALSQEVLKLEQQLSHAKPGVMIGEAVPPLQQQLPLQAYLHRIPPSKATRTLLRVEKRLP